MKVKLLIFTNNLIIFLEYQKGKKLNTILTRFFKQAFYKINKQDATNGSHKLESLLKRQMYA